MKPGSKLGNTDFSVKSDWRSLRLRLQLSDAIDLAAEISELED
jgi:hypothetical protein